MIRKARPEDVTAIQDLIRSNLDKLLPRDDRQILELIESFYVLEEDGEIVGCCCLEIYSPKIAIIKVVRINTVTPLFASINGKMIISGNNINPVMRLLRCDVCQSGANG